MSIDLTTPRNHANIKVIGVGGAGGNAVNRMVDEIKGVEFIAANTDLQALSLTQAAIQVQLGRAATRGLGAGARPAIGRQSAEESKDEIRKLLADTDMLFIAAGMGGGTGTGAAPYIAQLARELNILTVAVVSRPFSFEGGVRARNAEEGIVELRKHTDTLVIISNDQLIKTFDGKLNLQHALKMADMPLLEACRSITRLITEVGIINVDFADVRTIMANGGTALMGVGESEGEDRAKTAVAKALESPLLEDCEIQGARGVLVHISGGEDLQLHEIHEINQTIMDRVGAQAEIIFGASEVPDREGRLQVTIIATGFDQIAREAQRAAGAARQAVAPVVPVARPIAAPAMPAMAEAAPRVAEPVSPPIPMTTTPRREEVAARQADSALDAKRPPSVWDRISGR